MYGTGWASAGRWIGLGAFGFVMLGAAPLGAEEIIVESRLGGDSSGQYQEIEGKWLNSQVPPEVTKSGAPGLKNRAIGTRRMQFSRTDQQKADPPPAAARFLPMLKEPGRYRVAVTWPRSANAAPVQVTIRHAGGSEHREVEQDGRGHHGAGNADKWIDMGTYDFEAGAEQYVELRVDEKVRPLDPNSFGQIVADAVRFTSADGSQTTGDAQKSGGTSGALIWHDSLESAQAEASKQRKKLLVFFDADPCDVCRRNEKTLAEPAVKAVLKGFVLAKIDLDKLGRDKAARLGVFRGGTINVYSPEGEGLDQITQILDAREMADKLKGL